jgi:hypothetical protein
MLRPKTLWAFLFFAALAWPLSSATVNFLVVETVPPGEDSPGEGAPPFESSALWEACLLDVFFEAGHVVSNSPILRLDGLRAADLPGKNGAGGEFPREIRPELEGAALGGAEYFVLVLLTYQPGAADTKAQPGEADLRVYSLGAGTGSSGEKTFAGGYRFVYGGGALLNSPRETPPGGAGPGNRLTGPAGGEIESDRAKRLIRGLIPRIKD